MFVIGAGFTPANSAEHRGTVEEQNACEPDVFRLCVPSIPDEQAIVICLEQHARDLSPECRRVIAPGRQTRAR